jgi:hypothetical protein
MRQESLSESGGSDVAGQGAAAVAPHRDRSRFWPPGVAVARILAAKASLAAVLSVGSVATTPLNAQIPEREVFVPPISGSWDPILSLGQPSRWWPYFGVGYGVDPSMEADGAGVSAFLGTGRDLFSPVLGILRAGGQVYGGQRGEELDMGARLELESPAFFLRSGLDWNARSRRTDVLVGISFPPQRGGVFGWGGELRLDYLPGRAHAVQAGATFPIRRPRLGRTRPRTVDVELPRPPSRTTPPFPLTPTANRAMEEVREAMNWLVALGNVFWLTEDESLSHRATVREWRESLERFRTELEAREGGPSGPSGDGTATQAASTYDRKVRLYHRALDRAFGEALGAAGRDPEELGRPLADHARLTALEEIILPYNRTIGQYKSPDRLEGLAARARARWLAWLELNPPPAGRAVNARGVMDSWLAELECLRARISEYTGDSRMHWLSLALVLRPEEHQTRAQIDGILESALGRGFEGGNRVRPLDAPQFQRELLRTLRETRNYHLLWIHDIRGADGQGQPDRTGYELVTEGYLRALVDAALAYDETGVVPVYLILLDQHYYELNDGRRWMDLLERPLTHRVRLPSSHDAWRRRIEDLQDSLRAAVAESRRMTAETQSFGPDWVGQVVKVHVNITNPADFSFRSRRLLGPTMGADNLLRDHRKLILRDVAAEDPASGEMVLSGVGIGDHYADATWDDSGMVVQGPGAMEALLQAREVLLRNGLGPGQLPPPLRSLERAPDHHARMAALEAAGADALILQVHNRTGWGVKDATFVQMLLYDLAPPGTLLYVPDPLWTSFQWMAQLVSAALRGCHVVIVAPALGNAPSPGFLQMSVMQELVSRLVLIQEIFGDRIRDGGGDLRVGLFSRRVALDDMEGLAEEMEASFRKHTFLEELFPFPPEVRASIPWVAGVGAGGAGARTTPAPPRVPTNSTAELQGSAADGLAGRLPQLHRKTQWILDREVVHRLASSMDSLSLSEEGLVSRLKELESLQGWISDGPVLYFALGSLNKDIRSMALDGEILAVVAGRWALHSLLDLALLSAGVTWVESLEEVEELLPHFSPFRRKLGRWLHPVL